MKILADENVHSFIIKALRDTGFSVTSVREISGGIKDEEVIQWAKAEKQLLLTEDKDFGEWVFAHHIEGLSVLFLRYPFLESVLMASTIIAFLRNEKLNHPVFVTITPRKIRIRQL